MKHPVCASPFTRRYLDRSSDGGERAERGSGPEYPSGPRLSVESQSRDRSPRSAVQILGHWNSFTALFLRYLRRTRKKKKKRIKMEKGENSGLPRDIHTENSSSLSFFDLRNSALPILFSTLIARKNVNSKKAILFHRRAVCPKFSSALNACSFPQRLFCLHQLYSWRIARILKHK